MKTIFTVSLCLAASLVLAQPGWHRESISSSGVLNATGFATASTWMAVGMESDALGRSHPLVLSTTNGGAFWNRDLQQIGGGLRAVSCLDVTTAIAVGWAQNGDTDVRPLIIRTIDGGITWESQLIDTGYTLMSVSFATAKRGIAVGYNAANGEGRILRTDDGGKSWVRQSGNVGFVLTSVCLTDTASGTIAGWKGTILHTTNGGIEWNAQSSGTTTASYYGISFADVQTGIIVGVDSSAPGFDGVPLIQRTTDGGTTWSKSVGGVVSLPYGVKLATTKIGALVGVGASDAPVVARTSDGGTTWQLQSIGTTKAGSTKLASVSFFDVNTGAVAGIEYDSAKVVHPLLLHTTSGGVTGIDTNPVTTTAGAVTLLQNFPNPFNPSTTIRYILPQREWVHIAVYDVLGQDVAVLIDGQQDMGQREVRFDVGDLASGIYFYRMITGVSIQTKSLIILR